MKLKLILIFALVFAFGCTKKSSADNPSPQGGQDVGGGNTILSTKEDVIAAVQGANDIVLIFSNPNAAETPLPQIVSRLLGTEFEDVAGKVFFPNGWPKNGQVTGAIDSYFKRSRIILQDTGSCPSSDKKHADASVSSHKIGSDICVSVENLKKIPRPSLLREVLSLLIHECAHLVGLGEADAIKIQRKIAENLLEVETFHDVHLVAKKMKQQIQRAHALLSYAQELYKLNPQNPQVSYVVSEAVTHLTWQMPGYKDFVFFMAAIGKDAKLLGASMGLYKQAWKNLSYHFGGHGVGNRPAETIYNEDEVDREVWIAWRIGSNKTKAEVLENSKVLLQESLKLLELKKVDVETR